MKPDLKTASGLTRNHTVLIGRRLRTALWPHGHVPLKPPLYFKSTLGVIIREAPEGGQVRDIGFEVAGDHIEYWPRLLEEWCLVVERYCRTLSGRDAPYWHSERANVGLLSAAAWRAGLVALEEFPAKRSDRGNVKTGRCDLWIYSEHEPDGDAYEAKWSWSSVQSFRKDVTDYLGEACDEVANLIDTFYERRCGLLFAIPQCTTSVNVEDFVKIAKHCLQRNDVHAIAWAFPFDIRKTSEGEQQPRVVLLLRKQYDRLTERK